MTQRTLTPQLSHGVWSATRPAPSHHVREALATFLQRLTQTRPVLPPEVGRDHDPVLHASLRSAEQAREALDPSRRALLY
ncbi:MAG: hypothetical protein QM779_17755 [Propionicimonas sp.]|uniref:hypothetical protein n=1 Tax=Propionicimonas sp. TaxID=1955623 RepID=UPI003D0BC6C1